MAKKRDQTCMYGLTAEFNDDQALLEAAQKARDAGYQDVEAYSPYYVEGLAEVFEKPSNALYYVVVMALAVGAGVAFLLQYYTDVLDYPLNIAGRPYYSWQAFLIVTFELAILFAAFTAVGALFVRARLPMPYHPIFNAPNIERASNDGFFLCIQVTDRQFSLSETRAFLEGLNPVNVGEVPC